MKQAFTILYFLVFIQSSVFSQLGQHLNYNVNVNGTLRQYRLYIPPGHDGTEAWPLVFVFHGFNVSLDWQVGISQMYLVADTAKFLVVYPQALSVQDTNFNFSGKGWLVPGIVPLGAAYSDVEFVESLIKHVDDKPQYAVDTSRVFATGWSSGSEMAFYLGCVLGNKIAAVAGVAGQLSNVGMAACTPSRQMSLLYVQGSADIYVPLGGDAAYPPVTDLPEFWAAFNNCDPTPDSVSLPNLVTPDNSTVMRFDYADCDADHEVLFYRVDGGGHNWPGGWLPDGFPALHPINKDIHASVEIWNFFKRHPHPHVFLPAKEADADNRLVVNHQPEAGTILVRLPDNFTSFNAMNLRLFDLAGHAFLQATLQEREAQYEIGQIPKGIYFLELHGSQGRFLERLVVR